MDITNNSNPRYSNKRIVLGVLYARQQMTRREISEESGLSLPTVTQTVRELTEMGLVYDAGLQESSGGRRAAITSIRTDALHSVGICISRHHVRFALLDLGKEVLAEASFRTVFSDSPEYWEDIRARVIHFLNDVGIYDLRQVRFGLSFPGIFNSRSFTLEYAPTLETGSSIRLAPLREVFGEGLLVDNDAVLAAKAEVWYKPLQAPAVYLLLNRGVGGALLTGNGKNPFGPRSGEFGHMVIEGGGRECRCGNKGCLEVYCSAAFIADHYDYRPLEDFFRDLRMGSSRCKEIWEEYFSHLVIGVHNLRCIFDCDVIIGGEMTKFIEEYASEFNRHLSEISIFPEATPFVRMSNYGEFDSAIGAALLGIEKFIETI